MNKNIKLIQEGGLVAASFGAYIPGAGSGGIIERESNSPVSPVSVGGG